MGNHFKVGPPKFGSSPHKRNSKIIPKINNKKAKEKEEKVNSPPSLLGFHYIFFDTTIFLFFAFNGFSFPNSVGFRPTQWCPQNAPQKFGWPPWLVFFGFVLVIFLAEGWFFVGPLAPKQADPDVKLETQILDVGDTKAQRNLVWY